MFILYRPDSSLAENMAVRLKFNRHQKQLFLSLAEKDIDIEKMSNDSYLQKQTYYNGKSFIRGKLLTQATAERKLTPKIWQIYDRIEQVPEREFPLRGKDIQELHKGQPEQIGIILKDLEQKWVDSDFSLSKDELLARIKTKQVI